MDARVVGGAVAILTVVLTAVLATSLATLHQTEMGLKTNAFWQTLSPTIYYGGLHWVGAGGYFIKFQKTVLSTEFSTDAHDILHARTKDGLPIVLGISYQYAYIPDKLHDLYLAYLGDHDRVYFNTATHLISEESTRHTAYDFFDQPQQVAQKMQHTLDEYFEQHLFANVVALQINSRLLPEPFNDAILDSLTTKQNITATYRYVDRMNVTLETQLLVARQDALATVASAKGAAQAALANSFAAANVTHSRTDADVGGFRRVKGELDLDNADVLKYVYWDSLSGRGIGATGDANLAVPGYAQGSGLGLDEADVLVDLEPSVMARQGAP
eukprot:CAMPEP_0118868754 /NCGR_PEP_ID=MMETSP1163-20130328/12216_1 /TAXON_ID=124430 /ORGANISM="Phaeomonas parva, Strain CCMP2877" /LENGTH=327 /DNA_ID=CAMNT_0006803519 /DNA_START=65 /DNA_END=1048 /DNA_ORIENTATION=-